jgi:AbrB family looped-hinge helix DNA binding protein
VSLTIHSKVGRKYTIYLPKKIVESLGIKERDRVKLSIEKGKIVVEIVKDPLELALHGKKFTKISAEEVEQISLEEQEKHESSG